MYVYKRKVQKIGKNTFIVTLPSSWTREVGLEPRSEVLLEILPDRSLRIYKATSAPSRELVAEFVVSEECEEHDVAREVIAYYIAGTSIIKISYQSISRAIIDKGIDIARDRLIGLEVIDEGPNTIILQAVVDPNLSDIDSVIKRLKRIVISMHKDIIQYLTGRANASILDSVIARDNLADKLFLLALRQLTIILRDPHEMGRKGMDYVEVIHRVMFIKSLERIGDHAVYLAKLANKLNSIPNELLNLYSMTVDLFDEMAEAFIDMDKQKAIKIAKHIGKLKTLDEELRRSISSDKELGYYLSRFMDVISRIIARTIDAEETIIDITALRSLRSDIVKTNSNKQTTP